MTFEEAIKVSIKKYFDDDYEENPEYGPKTYTKKYFDDMSSKFKQDEIDNMEKVSKKNAKTSS